MSASPPVLALTAHASTIDFGKALDLSLVGRLDGQTDLPGTCVALAGKPKFSSLWVFGMTKLCTPPCDLPELLYL
jgi:hypothetical protein